MHTAIGRLIMMLCLALPLGSVAQQSPLIPIPQQLTWGKNSISLQTLRYIQTNDAALKKEVTWLQHKLAKRWGRQLKLSNQAANVSTIQLSIATVKAKFNQNEAYQLTVGPGGISLKANNSKGIFYGLQTLCQLINRDGNIPACNITDYPAFSWRGYMIDVGRNYQSVAQLKRQIDLMARYKLNIFHFHLTEDFGWRLQINKYPELTAALNQTRNPGKFYTVAEVKDLIAYCQERYITLVPEIDMPGHSAAFTRAFGVDMQSAKGLGIVKEVLTEICTTYNLPYIHIGADEVRITNKQFLPEVSALLKGFGKTVIGWAPGGNYTNETIRQLWKDEGEHDIVNPAVRYIDSRSLYISDMDPLNTVVTIFNRKFGNKPHGGSTLLGAEFCVWNDRRVSNEEELLSRNAVYPAMLAFAERSWRGGGYELAFNIGADTSERAAAFREFETRLLSHKQRYFAQQPFTYVKHTDIKWKLTGPFDNKGNLSAVFTPEQPAAAPAAVGSLFATGGTVWLWHTNSPAVKAWLPNFTPNSTYYASTSFYIDKASVVNFWIDFKDQSRSGADATPPAGQWDYKQSKIWVNGKLIPPPVWQKAGQPSGRLEEPLTDESFYYRQPISISVKKGWNKVLIKLPMDNFDKRNWQSPPKWMFTFIPVRHKGLNCERNPLKFDPNKN